MNKFVKLIVATLTGDTATETALKIQRQAESALKIQIANREAETVNLEGAIEDARAAEQKAFTNEGKLMPTAEDRAQYVKNLINARNAVIAAEEALEEHNKALEFLKSKYTAIQEAEV